MKTLVYKSPISIFLLVLITYFFSSFFLYKTGINKLYIQSEDTVPTMFIPVTLIKEQTLYLDTYVNTMLANYPHPDDKDFALGLIPFYLKQVSSHYLSAFPILPGLLALPVYFLPISFGLETALPNLAILAHISASIWVAISAVVLFKLLKAHFGQADTYALVLTYLYAFATINFSLVSQSLWQHGPLELFTLFGLYYFFDKRYFVSGMFLSLGVLARPTAIIPFAVLFGLLALSTRFNIGALLKYILGLMPSVLFFIWYTLAYYQGIQNNGYADQIFTEWKSNIIEGFLGLWISPSKGILVFTPVFIFSIIGFFIALKKYKTDFRYLFFALIVLIHTLVLGKWKHWYGGWSFGYRMASDIIPFLTLLLVPFIESEYFAKYKKLFFILFIISILIQIYGLVFFDGIWHAAYDRGYQDTNWLWSIKDSQFVFDIRRILVKIRVLDKACPACL